MERVKRRSPLTTSVISLVLVLIASVASLQYYFQLLTKVHPDCTTAPQLLDRPLTPSGNTPETATLNRGYNGKPFNPWGDFTFTRTNETSIYSSHRCIAAAPNSRRSDATSRTCWYQNVLYHVKTKTFHYYPHPKEANMWSAHGWSFQTEMETSIFHVRESYDTPVMQERHGKIYLPIIHRNLTEFPTDVVALSAGKRNPFFLLYRTSQANFGHIIWDDFLSLYTQLDLFELDEDQTIMPVPFFMDPKDDRVYLGLGCYPATAVERYTSCAKLYRRIFPAVWHLQTDCSGDIIRSSNWLQGDQSVGLWIKHPKEPCKNVDTKHNNVDAEYVLIPNMTVGSGRAALFSCYGECTIFRGPQLFRFRNYLMRQMIGDAYNKPPIGYITFSLPFGSSRGKGEVTLFEKEIQLVRQKYGEHAVKAVDMANITMREQAELVGNSVVFFTNHGGGSASTTFLPKGATALVYWAEFKRDIEFYQNVGFFQTKWISKSERSEMGKIISIVDFAVHQASNMYPNIVSRVRTPNVAKV